HFSQTTKEWAPPVSHLLRCRCAVTSPSSAARERVPYVPVGDTGGEGEQNVATEPHLLCCAARRRSTAPPPSLVGGPLLTISALRGQPTDRTTGGRSATECRFGRKCCRPRWSVGRHSVRGPESGVGGHPGRCWKVSSLSMNRSRLCRWGVGRVFGHSGKGQ